MLKFSHTRSTESAQNAHTCSLAPRSPSLVELGVRVCRVEVWREVRRR